LDPVTGDKNAFVNGFTVNVAFGGVIQGNERKVLAVESEFRVLKGHAWIRN
jgi:hypothetical protein